MRFYETRDFSATNVVGRDLEIFPTGGGFKHYRQHLPIALYAGAEP